MTQVFRGATVHTADDPAVIEPGQVVVRDGRVVEVGPLSDTLPEDATVHDLEGCHLTPGLVDAHTHLGVMPTGFAHESKDFNEMTSPVTPHMRASDGIWPGDVGFERARRGGVTSTCVLPGSANVVGGMAAALKTWGRDVEQMAIRDPAGLKVAFGYNVKHSHGLKGRAPLTRMGIAALFREAFEGALEYERRRAVDPQRPRDPRMEPLLQAMRRDIPVRAHAYRSDDILTALRLAREFGLSLVLEHAYEATLVLQQVVDAGVSVVHGPAFRSCGGSEHLRFDFADVKTLDEAGVCVALMTDHPIVPVEYLSLQAGLSVRAGLDPDRALRTITRNPAQILGLADAIGRIRRGLDADLVVWSGPPLEVASRVLATFIEGRCVYRDGDPRPVPGAAF